MSEVLLGILIPPNMYYIGMGICTACLFILIVLEAIKSHRTTKKESQKQNYVITPKLISWEDHLILFDLTVLISSMYLLFSGTRFLKLRVSNIGMIFNVIVGISTLLIFLESYRDPRETSKETETVIFSNFVFASLVGNQQFVKSIIDFLNLSNDIYITISLILVIGLHYAVFLFCVLYSIAILIRKVVLISNLKLRRMLKKILNVIHQKKVIKWLTHPLLRWYVSRHSSEEPRFFLFALLCLIEVPIGLIKVVVTLALVTFSIILTGVLSLFNFVAIFIEPLIHTNIKKLQQKVLIFSAVLALPFLYIQFAKINVLTSIQNRVFELIVAIIIIPYLLSIMIELNKKEAREVCE